MSTHTNPTEKTTDAAADNLATPSSGEVWTVNRVRALGVTTTLATAASVLGISRSQAYRLAATDAFPAPLIRAGSRIIVPVAALLHLLQPDPVATGGGRLDADATDEALRRLEDEEGGVFPNRGVDPPPGRPEPPGTAQPAPRRHPVMARSAWSCRFCTRQPPSNLLVACLLQR